VRAQIVFMFSGQGSHYHQMGRALFDQQVVFRDWMERLDIIAREMLGRSVVEHLYREENRPSAPFDNTLLTHPAIFMVEYSLARVLVDAGVSPTGVLGASLGEFTSLAVADALDYDSALRAVIRQAEHVESHCPAGGMIAILADPGLYQREPGLFENCDLVSVNLESHFVIAGQRQGIARALAILKQLGASFQVLPVSQGFHSSAMNPAAPVYRQFLRDLTLRPPRIRFASCVEGELLQEVPSDYLWQAARGPILFREAVKALVRADTICLDLGPGGTLANFIKHDRSFGSTLPAVSIMTRFGADLRNLENALDIIRRATTKTLPS